MLDDVVALARHDVGRAERPGDELVEGLQAGEVHDAPGATTVRAQRDRSDTARGSRRASRLYPKDGALLAELAAGHELMKEAVEAQTAVDQVIDVKPESFLVRLAAEQRHEGVTNDLTRLRVRPAGPRQRFVLSLKKLGARENISDDLAARDPGRCRDRLRDCRVLAASDPAGSGVSRHGRSPSAARDPERAQRAVQHPVRRRRRAGTGRASPAPARDRGRSAIRGSGGLTRRFLPGPR